MNSVESGGDGFGVGEILGAVSSFFSQLSAKQFSAVSVLYL